MQISCSPLLLPFLCKAVEYTPTPAAQVIACVDDGGRPVAGVIYDGFNGSIVMCHIWVDAERKPCREWFAAIFDYPFNHLGVTKIVGQVRSSNIEARMLDQHFGFVKEATISDYYPGGDSLLVYTLTKDQCRILSSPSWKRVVDKVRGIR